MDKPRFILTSKIREFVFPYLENLGFKEFPSREMAEGGVSKTTYPFGTWTRYNPDSSMDLIEFKFDKYGAAKFEFDFAQIQKHGGYGTYKFFSQDEGSAYGIGEFGRYRPRYLTTSNPVSLTFSRSLIQNESSADSSIKQWMTGLTQVEDWFRMRRVGNYLVTFENLPRGVQISRGFPSLLVFKSTSLSYSRSTKNKIFDENNVKTYEQALRVANETYKAMGKHLDLSSRLWWLYDGL